VTQREALTQRNTVDHDRTHFDRTHPASTARRRLAATSLVVFTLGSTTGCGTLLFPERQHEDHSGDLDPNVLVLDGIGLLFFVVPGLVAFVVDFSTGAIYLPVGVERGEGPFFGDDGVVDEL